MIRFRRKPFLLSAVFVCVLLLAVGINGTSVASATSQESLEPTVTLEKSLTILNDVVGVDTAKYNTQLDSYSQDLYFETLPQENVKYVFESDKSKLEVIYTFVNGKLRSVATYVLDGTPQTTQPTTDMLGMAKDFINKYQTYSGASYYETLKPMLDNVEPNKSITKTSENTKLEVTGDANYASFRWTYMVNGVEVPAKCVALYFEQGFLNYFVDTWSLYKIGSTDILLSEEEAVEIAMNAAKTYSWKVGLGGDNWTEVTDFKVAGVSETKLDFGNYIEKKDARDEDPFTLYPGWRVRLYLDKIYPGNVYGLDIGIWADTKEVHDIRTMFTLGAYPISEDNEVNANPTGQASDSDSNLPPLALIALPVTIATAFAVTIVYYGRKKSTSSFSVQGVSKRSLKFGGTLLCLLFALAVFPMVTSTVKAGTRSIVLYGSTWNIVSQEYSAAVGVVDSMEYYFDTYAGYDCFDAFGSYTQKSNVLSWASILEQSYDHVTMFHYGHGGYDYISGVKHWSYFDNDGPSTPNDYIWDYEVYPQTWRSKTWFVMLWSCRQGDTQGYYDYSAQKAVGMPYAWHHPVDPYYDTFIGFKDASMPLTQISKHHSYVTYNYWLIRFIYHGTYNHRSIMQALNQASLDYFGLGYYQTELDDGFHAVWPGIGEGDGWMKIYGSPNIYFY